MLGVSSYEVYLHVDQSVQPEASNSIGTIILNVKKIKTIEFHKFLCTTPWR